MSLAGFLFPFEECPKVLFGKAGLRIRCHSVVRGNLIQPTSGCCAMNYWLMGAFLLRAGCRAAAFSSFLSRTGMY